MEVPNELSGSGSGMNISPQGYLDLWKRKSVFLALHAKTNAV
jgi:hypothetical protein